MPHSFCGAFLFYSNLCFKEATVIRKAILIFFFSIFALRSFSQNIIYNSSDTFSFSTLNEITDSSQSTIFFHEYNYSFLHQHENKYRNIGSAYETLQIRNDFFNIGFNIYKDYNLKSDFFFKQPKSKYYSQLKYLLGTRKEQVISIEHQQKLLKILRAGVLYSGIASPGFYKKQFNNFKNLSVFLNFTSSPNTYSATVFYFSNKIIAEENGGIINDTLLEIYKGQEQAISVQLNNAEHRLRSKGYCLNHYYNFINGSSDSTENVSIPKKFFGIEHTAEYSKQSFVYSESSIDTGYYLFNFQSESSTYDSLSFKKLSNQVYFSIYNLPIIKSTPNVLLNFKTGTVINSYKSHQYIYDSTFSNNSVDILLNLNNPTKWNLTSAFKKAFYKTIESPYILESRFFYKVNKYISKIGVLYRNQIIPPDYISEIYYSNHFTWANNFNNRKESVYKLFANFFNDQVSASAYKYTVHGYIFYDELSKYPYQNNHNLDIYKGELNIHYRLGQWHLLSNDLFNFSSANEIIRFPKYDLTNSIYYENYFFKKALYASIGARCRYQSAYYADALNPATGTFYIQNGVKIGDYPYFDAFIDMTIKTAKIFVMVEHVTAGIGRGDYFYMPHYPAPPRTLKLGLSWTFND